jgi:hypothetical protein
MICLNVPEFTLCGARADTNMTEKIKTRESTADLVIVFPPVLPTLLRAD